MGVGESNHFANGGTTGSILRPFALRKCSDVAMHVKGIEILGSGGIVSGDNALAFINYGASRLKFQKVVAQLTQSASLLSKAQKKITSRTSKLKSLLAYLYPLPALVVQENQL